MLAVVGLLAMVLASAQAPEARDKISFRGLGHLPGGLTESKAHATSEDGRVVVGESASSSGMQGFVWTAEKGMRGIGCVDAVKHTSEAKAVSPDGTVVVGYSIDRSGTVGIRWTEAEGLKALPRLPGANDCCANGVSRLGTVIVGTAQIPSDTLLFWTKSYGPNEVQQWSKVDWAAKVAARLADTIGCRWVGGSPSVIDGGLPRFEFYQAFEEPANEIVCYVDYRLASEKNAGTISLQGPISGVTLRASGGMAITGVSASGGVCVGDISWLHWRQETKKPAYVKKGIGAFAISGEEFVIPSPATISTLKKEQTLPDEYHATAVSANGKTVVGYSLTGRHSCYEIWVLQGRFWESKMAMKEGDPTPFSLRWLDPFKPGTADSYAWSVSGDGRVVVGEGKGGAIGAFFMTSAAGIVPVQDYLRRYCPKQVEGWRLMSAQGISADGRTVVGWGFNPQGKTEAWMAKIGDVAGKWRRELLTERGSDGKEKDED